MFFLNKLLCFIPDTSFFLFWRIIPVTLVSEFIDVFLPFIIYQEAHLGIEVIQRYKLRNGAKGLQAFIWIWILL